MDRLPSAILICVIFFPFSPRLPMSTSFVVKVLRFGGPRGRGHRKIAYYTEKKDIRNENKWHIPKANKISVRLTGLRIKMFGVSDFFHSYLQGSGNNHRQNWFFGDFAQNSENLRIRQNTQGNKKEWSSKKTDQKKWENSRNLQSFNDGFHFGVKKLATEMDIIIFGNSLGDTARYFFHTPPHLGYSACLVTCPESGFRVYFQPFYLYF